MTEPATALLYGFFGSNHGDRAVTRGAVQLLREAGVDGEIRVVTPPLTKSTGAGWRTTAATFADLSLWEWESRLSLFQHGRTPSFELLEALLQLSAVSEAIARAAGVHGCRRVCFGGGEQIFSYSPADDWTIFGKLLPLLVAAGQGAAVIGVPATFGPFQSGFSTALFTRFAALVEPLLVRDAVTAETLSRDFGLAVSGGVAADPAFFLPTTARTRRAIGKAGPRFALVPRLEGSGLRLGAEASKHYLDRQRRDQFKTSSALNLYRDLCHALIGHSEQIGVFVQADRDLEVCQGIIDAFISHPLKERLRLHQPGSLSQYIRELSFFDVVLTSRFHSAIFAVMVGATPLGLFFAAHGHKMPGLFAALGAADLAFCVDGDATDAVAAAALATVAARIRRGPALQERAEALKAGTVARLRPAAA